MARKKTEAFQDCTLHQLKAYSDTNPAEGLRIASECRKAATYAAKQYASYQKDKALAALGISPDLFDPSKP